MNLRLLHSALLVVVVLALLTGDRVRDFVTRELFSNTTKSGAARPVIPAGDSAAAGSRENPLEVSQALPHYEAPKAVAASRPEEVSLKAGPLGGSVRVGEKVKRKGEAVLRAIKEEYRRRRAIKAMTEESDQDRGLETGQER